MLAGWMTTEIGRQPWVVYGVMRTADAASHHSALVLSASLLVFVLVYCAVFGTGITYLLKVVAVGPGRGPPPPDVDRRSRPRGRSGSAVSPAAPAIDTVGEREIAMGIDLPLIWVLIIAFGLMMYVVMDGFDLGIGILFPFVRRPHDRDTMVNTVAPVWDGNETWLVLGGAGPAGAPFRWPTRCC